MSPTVLILPGIGNSGSDHWQTYWEAAHPDFVRVPLGNWNHPVCSGWLTVLEKAVADSGPDTVLVAHSLACLLVAHWAASHSQPIRGALLVSVPDPSGPNFPLEATGFSPVPLQPFVFPCVIVSSTNDPYGSEEYMRHCAEAWGSQYISVGALGHINSESALGDWPQGFAILQELIRSTD